MKSYSKIIAFAKKVGNEINNTPKTFNNISTVDEWLTNKDIEIERSFKKLVQKTNKSAIIYSDLTSYATDKSDIWIIDPISHTYSFMRDLPHFTVIISHVQNNEIKFACIYDPRTKEMFTAYKDGGAFLNDERIKVSKGRKMDTILYDYYPLGINTRENNLDLFAALTHVGRVKSYGSYGIHYAYVACGRAEVAITQNRDIYPEFAGNLLVSEAGGKMTDHKGDDIGFKSRGILASNNIKHEEISKLLGYYQINNN